MPSPVLSCAVAAFADEVRSGWLGVRVLEDGASFSFSDPVMGADGFNTDGLSESPLAGRSTIRSG
jgi:hypothetical protein